MNDPRVEIAKIAHRAKVEWIDRHSRDDYGNEDYLAMSDALTAADAADREQGIHRVRVDDATVERVAEVIYRKKNPQGNWAGHTRIFKDVYRAEAMPLIEAMLGDES